jgi:hypothetical protein
MLLGFMEAPFNHVHDQGDDEDHHATEAAHVHLRRPAVESHGPAIQQLDPADDERLVTWFQTIEQSAFTLYLAPQASKSWQPAPRREFARPVPIVCSHDPPLNPALPSRAPPTASV